MILRARRSWALRGLAVWTAIAAAPSCGDQRGKLAASNAGSGAIAGNAGTPAEGGAGGGAGNGGSAGQVAAAGDGGANNGGASTLAGGAGGEGGATTAGGAALGGAAGSPSGRCVYQLDEGSTSSGGEGGAASAGAGGEGGARAVPYTIKKATSRLIGDYLTDSRGLSLYVFGSDLAGDCQSPPVSTCTGDCLKSWPVFHSPERLLADGLDEAAFGSILRPDGLSQTTYFGWPLYFYANDLKAGDVTGHGSGVWGLAETILPNIVVRRVGMDRFLADGAGHTLYAFTDDTRGTATEPARSACTDACRAQHPPFTAPYIGAISTLEPRDFGFFARGDGGVQLTYKGAPLYFSLLDHRPGDVNGTNDAGFTLVLR